MTIKKSYVQIVLLFCVTILTFLSLTIIKSNNIPTAHAENGERYETSSTSLVIATAYQDGLNDVSRDTTDDTKRETFEKNLNAVLNAGNFGNVGMLVGPYSNTENTNVMSTMYTPISLDTAQIRNIDNNTDKSATKYQKFGIAVRNLNERGMKVRPYSASIGNSLNGISAAAASFTGMGTSLLRKYNPAPVILAFLDCSLLYSNEYNENKLIELIRSNANLTGMINLLGYPSGILPTVPLSFVITACIIMFLLVTSVLMTFFNGRAAGENIRKALVRLVITAVGIPLVAHGLNLGVNFLDDFTHEGADVVTEEIITQHLNFADWASMGFTMPAGTAIYIDSDNNFVLSGSAIKEINHWTYDKVTGSAGSDQQVANRIVTMAREGRNKTTVAFVQASIRNGDAWETDGLFRVAEALGENNSENLVEDVNGFMTCWYIKLHGLNMTLNGSVATITSNGYTYGISPIAATNVLRTDFSSSKITSTLKEPTISTIVHYANRYTTNDSMNPVIRFLATYSMIMAAITGLFSILSAGFGGLISGGAKTAFGGSAGFGQALGGALALVGGVFGIGLIMTLTFGLLDPLYIMVVELFSGTTADDSILAPIGEIFEGIPILGPSLAKAAKDITTLIVTIMGALMLPKFGGIPIKMFCQALANLPGMFADKAQAMENHFTGDFRGGSGGGLGGGGNAMSAAAESMKAQAAAIGTGAAAIGGFALSKIGAGISNKYSDSEGDTSGDTITDNDSTATNAENMEEKAVESVENTDEHKTEGPDTINEASDTEHQGGDEQSQEISGHEAVTSTENASSAEKASESDSKAEKSAESTAVDQNDSLAENNMENRAVTESDSDNEHATNNATSAEDSADTQNISSEDSLANATNQTELNATSDSVEESDMESASLAENNSNAESVADSENLAEIDSSTVQTTDPERMAEQPASDALSNKDATNTSTSPNDSMMEKTNASNGNGDTSPNGVSGHDDTQAKNVTNENTVSGANSSEQASSSQSDKPKTNTSDAKSGNKQKSNNNDKGRKFMRALGKGLQAAGGHTTGSQALAGLLHIGGAAAGLDKATGKVLNNANKNAQRKRDIKDGLGPQHSQNNANTGNKAQNNAQKGAQNGNDRNAVRNARINQAIAARETQMQEDDRR